VDWLDPRDDLAALFVQHERPERCHPASFAIVIAGLDPAIRSPG